MKFVRIVVCIWEVRGLNLDRKLTVLAQIFFVVVFNQTRLFKLWNDSCLSCLIHFIGHKVLLVSTTLN